MTGRVRAHTSAVVALLTEVDVYVSRAPADAALPYVVLHPTQGLGQGTSLAGDTDWWKWPFRTVGVASTAEQAQALAERLDDRLLDKRPGVAGYQTTRIRKDASLGIEVNENVAPPLYQARDLWALDSIPS